jgi:nicotinamidase/pyrazinamidase
MSILTAQDGVALLILGVQPDTLPGNEALLAPLNQVIDLFQLRGLPIYAVRTSADASFAPEMGLPAFAKVLAMKTPEGSAFAGTPLDFQIKMYGIKQLIVAGYPTACVSDSVRDALKAGYAVSMLSDAVPHAVVAACVALGASTLTSAEVV